MGSVVTATQARQNFFKLVAKADNPGSSVTITVDGEPRVVMMSLDEFEGWQETLDIMADKNLVKAIKEGITDKVVYSEESVKKEFGL